MKRNLLIAVLALVLSLCENLKSQIPFIRDNGIFTYFVGKTEPPSDWKSADFNDSGWSAADTAVIGYGWSKFRYHTRDSIVIEQTISLYLRLKFEVTELSSLKDLNFEADYDDGFIIYLNGEEIARKNIGKPGEIANYNTLADRSHEACAYRTTHAAVNGIYIDSLIVKKLIRKGQNVFAVHVLNDSINGSDLSFNANVFNLPDCGDFYYGDRWVKYFRQLPLDSSKFPIVFINTDEYGIPLVADIPIYGLDKKVVAQISIIDKKNQINRIGDPIDFTGRVTVERRGQTSLDYPKMCFNLETQNELGENLDTAIMGMPSNNDWILNSNYGDKTIIRSELTFGIGRRMGHYEPRTQYCELVLNGEYQGLYVFMENIKRDKNRVSVAKRDSINPTNGGYVFKYDKSLPGEIQYVSPKKSDITKTEKDYLNNLQKTYRAVLKSSYFLKPDSGYMKYISGKSLIDNIVINELTKNCDAYLFSTYFHKDKDSKDGRIKFGPLWDYDLAYCGAAWQEGDKTNGWQFALPSSSFLYIPQLFRDTALTKSFARRWFSLRKSFLTDDSFFAIIDSLTSNIKESRIKNYEVWPIIDRQYLWPVVPTYTYEDDVNVIKNWTSQRMKWIDENIEKIYYPLDINPQTFSTNTSTIDVYPNPFADHVTVRVGGEQGSYQVVFQGLDGKTIIGKQLTCNENEVVNLQFTNGDLGKLKNGIFFVLLVIDGQIIHAKKIIKISTN